jgi:hypothetical protein
MGTTEESRQLLLQKEWVGPAIFCPLLLLLPKGKFGFLEPLV